MTKDKKTTFNTQAFLTLCGVAAANMAPTLSEPSIPEIAEASIQLTYARGETDANGANVGLTFKDTVPLFICVPIEQEDDKVVRRGEIPNRLGTMGRGQFNRPVAKNATKAVSVRIGLPNDPKGTYWLSQVPSGYMRVFEGSGDQSRTVDELICDIVDKLDPKDVFPEESDLRASGMVYTRDKVTYLAIPANGICLFLFVPFGNDGHLAPAPTSDNWSYLHSSGRVDTNVGERAFRGGPTTQRAQLVTQKIWDQLSKRADFITTLSQAQGKNRAMKQGMTGQRPQRDTLQPHSLAAKASSVTPTGTGSEIGPESF